MRLLRRVDSLTPAHVDQLVALYQREWWTKGRTRDEAQRMLAQCDVIVAFEEENTGALVAFARVLTDYVYKALVFDVIVREDHRGRGLGRALLDAIMSDPRLRNVAHLELYCKPELIPFYERWGFTARLDDVTFMRRLSTPPR